MEWFTKAAVQGDEDARYHLGEAYHRGNGVTQSYARAIEYYTLSAEKGCIAAMHTLGALAVGHMFPQRVHGSKASKFASRASPR